MEGAGGATVLLSFPPSSSLYIVPSLPGRLLRFQGDLMHSVPRPALAYFDSDVVPGGTNHLIFTKVRYIIHPTGRLMELVMEKSQHTNTISHDRSSLSLIADSQ